MNQTGLVRVFVLVTVAGIMTRLGVVWLSAVGLEPKPALPDEIQYWEMARSLAAGSGLRDELGLRATRMPLYPMFLALFVDLPGGRVWALAIQAAAGALACGCSAVLGFRVAPAHLKTHVALISGLLAACDPFLVYFCSLVLTEGLFTAALCAFVAVSWPTRNPGRAGGLLRWLASGALFAICVYLRPAAVGLLAAWCVFVIVRHRLDRVAILGAGSLWLALIVLLSPWGARNRTVTGEWVWLTTNMGISLYDGVHAQADGASNLATIKHVDLPEIARDAHFRAESWRIIRSEPLRVLRLAGAKFSRTWNLWPNAEGYQSGWMKFVAGTWTILVLGSALAGAVLLRKDRGTVLGLLMPALYFTALHVLFVGSIRYRLPTMPMIEVLSALGLAGLLARLRIRSHSAARGSPAR